LLGCTSPSHSRRQQVTKEHCGIVNLMMLKVTPPHSYWAMLYGFYQHAATLLSQQLTSLIQSDTIAHLLGNVVWLLPTHQIESQQLNLPRNIIV